MHGHTAPKQTITDPIAARIAELSDEYLSATVQRCEEIGEEISALISGQVVPLRRN